jgi:hypothetical protein
MSDIAQKVLSGNTYYCRMTYSAAASNRIQRIAGRTHISPSHEFRNLSPRPTQEPDAGTSSWQCCLPIYSFLFTYEVISSTELNPCVDGNETTTIKNGSPLPSYQSELGGLGRTEIPQKSRPHYSTQLLHTVNHSVSVSERVILTGVQTSQFDLTPLTRRDLLILQDEIKNNMTNQIVDRVFEKVNDAWQLHGHSTGARGVDPRNEDDDGWMGDVESSPAPRIRRETKHRPRTVNNFHVIVFPSLIP